MPNPAIDNKNGETPQINDKALSALPDNSKYIPKKIPVETILELRNKGLSMSQVATLLGCTKPNIVNRLKSINHKLNTLKDYKSNIGDILALKHRSVINHLTNDKLKDASAYQLVGMSGILFDKWRIAEDKSTQNIGIIHSDIAAIKAQEGDK